VSRLAGVFGVLAVLALSMGFAALNGGQHVTLRLGFATLYGVPLTVVAFGGLVAGMVIMLGAGIHSDLKVRRILRARLMEEDLEEKARFIDRSQQDLFEEEEQDAGQEDVGEQWAAGGERNLGDERGFGHEQSPGDEQTAGQEQGLGDEQTAGKEQGLGDEQALGKQHGEVEELSD
jgi:uncharacterized integral membrane protein